MLESHNPNKSIRDYLLRDLFNVSEIQLLQDLFSKATGVASIITETDGTPITHASGRCDFCVKLLQDKQISEATCYKNNIHSHPDKSQEMQIHQCELSGFHTGIFHIIAEEEHIANLIICQALDSDHLVKNSDDLSSIKRMPREQFETICQFLYKNVQALLTEIKKNAIIIEKSINVDRLNKQLEKATAERTFAYEEINNELEELNSELEETNALLEQEIIQHQEVKEKVIQLNNELEQKVIERTCQLEDLNASLEEEIAERILIEEALNNEKVLTDAIFNSVPGMIYLYDDMGNLVRWNRKHEEMTGYTSEELSHMTLMDWYKGDMVSQNAVTNGLIRSNETGFGDAEAYLQTRFGTAIPMYFTASPVIIKDKNYFAGIGIEMTQRKRIEDQLRRSERKLKAMFENIADVIVIIDVDGRVKYKSPNVLKWYGKEDAAFIGSNFFHTVHPDDLANLRSSISALAQKKDGEIKVEYRHASMNGKYCTIELIATNMLEDDVIKGILINYRDISDRKRKEEENQFLSYHDSLTGLYNRRFYEEELYRLDTVRNLPISVIMGDVNGLKIVNDAFGHTKGDQLLVKAAQAFKDACRAEDVVARWGGDEFVVLLPKANEEETERIVRRIKSHYENEFVNAVKISISFGWATKNHVDEDMIKVLKSAEDDMYKHKIISNQGIKGNIINTIINTLHEKNPREEQHSKRVSQLCQYIGEAIGLSDIEVSRLKVIGLLHDIGKIAIEESILNKPGRLTEDEFEEIRRHPDIGYRILSASYETLDLADCILAHHERWDGRGYPKGIKGEDIPNVARIIAIADTFDAMTSERPYRKALSKEVALEEIRKNAGTQFDPNMALLFVEKIKNQEL